MMYVLDSDHLSLHQRGHEPLRSHLLTISPDSIAITIISVEELLRGRLAQVRRAATAEARVQSYYWLGKTLEYLCDFPVLAFDARAEAYFQSIRDRKLKVGAQDLKIAAIAMRHKAILVTRNQQDFAPIPGLEIENWA